jgi:hypothetical protein
LIGRRLGKRSKILLFLKKKKQKDFYSPAALTWLDLRRGGAADVSDAVDMACGALSHGT